MCPAPPASLEDSTDGLLDDKSVKFALRHFDLRVVHTCSIIDACVRACACKPSSPASSPSQLEARNFECCVKGTILLSHMSQRVMKLRGSDEFDACPVLLHQVQ